MPLFVVSGISRVSGERMSLHVHAADPAEAREVASRNGVTPTAVGDARRTGRAGEPRPREPAQRGRHLPGR